ncbi:hypothetical protein QR680_012838 [Steinernema hermaphroditum]|uniref:Rho GTPase-activating protein 26 n=1 Tax=Steinernema hermaphroditum TaxID=289476 RepID=A0AA39I689_9BILA|nr:hypothetical protein QR680_012838 [Steinernema hermaphroditum]
MAARSRRSTLCGWKVTLVALEALWKARAEGAARQPQPTSKGKQSDMAQRSFAKTLCDFKLETVGSTQTDDERVIANCLKEFGKLIKQVEDHRSKIIEDAETLYIDPLRKFRVERIGRTLQEEKKKYEKESTRFYANLEKYLHLSTVRKNDFREADAQLGLQQRAFCQASLQYVAEIQAVQERMKFEFVETLSSFLYSWLTFYHVGHVIHEDFKPFLDGVQVKVQKAKENFETTQAEAEVLKQKILASHIKNAVFPSNESSGNHVALPSPSRPSNSNIKQGYMFVQEKSKISKTITRDVLRPTWTKYYCVYSKETRIFTMIPVSSKTDMKCALEQSVSFKLKSCTRRASDSIDKRFCFDVVADDRPGDVMTFQALSEEDRRQWLEALDGNEPIYSPGAGPPNPNSFNTMLDDAGFEFVHWCIRSIEDKGIREQGIYRNCGVTSKVQKMMQVALDKRKSSSERMAFGDEIEWETKTISSAIKTFLRNLPEPLMTFELHNHFINAAKMDDQKERVGHIHYYVYQLPETHRKMLEIIVRHLRRVADRHVENLMTVGNLGVCFGPTLLRPKEETMAAIMDIKFCNVVIEVLIANCQTIFGSPPPTKIGTPCPPKPLHTLAPSASHSSSNNSDVRPSEASGFEPSGLSRPKTIAPPPPIRLRQPLIALSADSHIYDSVPLASMEPSLTESQTARFGAALSASAHEASTSATPVEIRRADNHSVSPSTASRNKSVASSYAPSYSSFPSESLFCKFQKRHSGGNLVGSFPSGCSSQTPPSTSASGPSAASARSMSTSLITARPSPLFLSLIRDQVQLQPSRRVKTLYACTAGHETELSFAPNQIITNVYESKEEGWLVGTLNGKTGLVPINYVAPLP